MNAGAEWDFVCFSISPGDIYTWKIKLIFNSKARIEPSEGLRVKCFLPVKPAGRNSGPITREGDAFSVDRLNILV